jgi:hypothetical protein
LSGKKPGQQHSTSLTTDEHGNAAYSTTVLRTLSVSVAAPGFYPTYVGGQLSEDVGTRDNPLQVVLKRVRQPTAMIAKQAFIRVEMLEGAFSYDLVVGDLLPPLGRGEHSDLTFVWARPTRNDISERRAQFNVQAPGDDNGFIAFLRARSNLASVSKLVSDYHAPQNGYWGSTRLAHDRLLTTSSDPDAANAVDGAFNDDLCYYIRIRSKDRPLYGKIYRTITQIPRPDFTEFKFLYYLNPSGDTNVECDPKASYLPPHKGELEYPLPEP